MKSVLVLAFCLAFAAAQTNGIFDATVGDRTFVITDALKTSQHPYFQQGFPVGYVVNGTQGATLILTAGYTYTFKVSSQCNHPFYIAENPSGQNLSEISTGVVTGNYQQVCGGISMMWTPPTSLIGNPNIFYQCRTHSKMGWKIAVVAETFCNKYSRALGISNEALVTAVVTDVFTAAIDPASPLLDYFNGRLNPSGIDYTNAANSAQTQTLAANLVAFFGIALGCTDPNYPPYQGVTDMAVVHAGMPIAPFEFNTFNTVVLNVIRSKGVTDERDLAAVLAVLNSLQPAICNQQVECKNSICDRYSRLLNITNVQLVTVVVTQTFGKAVADGSPLKGFFDGTIPAGSTDFVTPGTNQNRLVNNLVAFFGQQGILTCTDANYPAYTVQPTLREIHAPMPIGVREFTTFNSAVVSVLNDNGVAPADQAAVAALLASTKPDICNLRDCNGTRPIDVVFAVDVVPKRDHPFTGQGFPSGFRIDGIEGRELFLEPGRIYAFRNAQPCTHPLYLTTNEDGQGLDGITAGVTYPQGDPTKGCAGADVIFEPQQSQVGGPQLYYQCQNHAKMGYKINVGGAPPTRVTVPPTFPPGTTGINTISLTTGVPQPPAADSSNGSSLVPAFVTLLLLALLL